MCSVRWRGPKGQAWQVHQGAEGSESAMALEGVICRHGGFSLLVLARLFTLWVYVRGASGSTLNDRASLGVNFSPVNVNMPEPFRKVLRSVIPLGVPSSSVRVISWFLSCRLSWWFVCMFLWCVQGFAGSLCICRLCPPWGRTTSRIHLCMHGWCGTGETILLLGQSMKVHLWHVWHLLVHKHMIYFLFRKYGGGGVGLGGLNKIKQPCIADFSFVWPLDILEVQMLRYSKIMLGNCCNIWSSLHSSIMSCHQWVIRSLDWSNWSFLTSKFFSPTLPLHSLLASPSASHGQLNFRLCPRSHQHWTLSKLCPSGHRSHPRLNPVLITPPPIPTGFQQIF